MRMMMTGKSSELTVCTLNVLSCIYCYSTILQYNMSKYAFCGFSNEWRAGLTVLFLHRNIVSPLCSWILQFRKIVADVEESIDNSIFSQCMITILLKKNLGYTCLFDLNW